MKLRPQCKPEFHDYLDNLPEDARKAAKEAYKLWKVDHLASSLDFKQVNPKKRIWQVRAGHGYRALGQVADGVITWAWIGKKSETPAFLDKLRRGKVKL